MLWLFDRARPLGLIPLPRDTAQSPSPCEIARVITFLSFLRNSSAISTVYLCQKNYIRMFLGKKINEQCISIFSNLIPKLTWACFVVFIVSHLWFFLCVCTQFGHAKIGPCGGNGGKAHDIMVLPHRLENVTICSDIVIHSLAFSYSDHDGQHHTAGPWGGDGGNNQTVCVYCKLFHCQFV